MLKCLGMAYFKRPRYLPFNSRISPFHDGHICNFQSFVETPLMVGSIPPISTPCAIHTNFLHGQHPVVSARCRGQLQPDEAARSCALWSKKNRSKTVMVQGGPKSHHQHRDHHHSDILMVIMIIGIYWYYHHHAYFS